MNMNKALTSKFAAEDHYDELNASYYRLLQQLLVGAGEDEDRYSVLEPVAKSHLKVLEARKHNWTQFYCIALAAGATVATLPDIASCDNLDTDSIVIGD